MTKSWWLDVSTGHYMCAKNSAQHVAITTLPYVNMASSARKKRSYKSTFPEFATLIIANFHTEFSVSLLTL